MASLVAIHQPNFFPWLGYFDKIRRADVFVFLDDVQLQKTGGSWTNRVQLLHAGESCWLTAPIDRSFHGARSINEITFAKKIDWRAQALAKLEGYYRRAPFYAEALEVVGPLMCSEYPSVAAFNMNAITQLMNALELGGRTLVCSSSMPIKAESTQRLIDITLHMGGTHYLSGGGAAGYQEESLFVHAGLQLVHQRFAHPQYPQGTHSQFIAGLSIIDVLMHCGIRATVELIHNKHASAQGDMV